MAWTDCYEQIDIGGTDVAQNVATIRCLEPLFKNVVTSLMALAGVGLFVMLIVGGFNFLFSGGDQKKLETARGTITQAIAGLVIMSVAYLIISTIAAFTGVEGIKTFKIDVGQ